MGGSSILQAEDSLEIYVKKYLEKPVVRIKIQNFRFSVMGEVEREATLISGDSYLTLLQAIALAGGPSEFGDMSRVKVLRRMGDETYVFYANMLNEEYLSSPFYFIQPNDVIIIMPLKQRSYLKYMSPNLGLITATTSLIISILTLITIL
jgi:polysaccharide export outer membrane protein